MKTINLLGANSFHFLNEVGLWHIERLQAIDRYFVSFLGILGLFRADSICIYLNKQISQQFSPCRLRKRLCWKALNLHGLCCDGART